MKNKSKWYLLPCIMLGLSFTAIATHAEKTSSPLVGVHSQPPENWTIDNKELGGGKLRMSRDFDSTIPAVGNEGWQRANAPKHFYSMKPPNDDIQGFIEGKYDKEFRAVVKALPPWTNLTVYHEPEDNMDGKTFYKLIKHAHDVAHDERKDRNDIHVWYVAMSFQWETNSKGNVSTPEGWLDAAKYVDRVGVDVYARDNNFVDIGRNKGFMAWWNKIAVPAGKIANGKWGIMERGISRNQGADEQIKILQADWQWATTHNADIFLYWNADTNGNNYKIVEQKVKDAFQKIAAEGRQQ
jgi:hypothetical protein